MALVLQVFLPASAQASGGMWIEICGESGVETVLVDMSDADSVPTRPAPCRDCCPCVFGASPLPALSPEPMGMLSASDGVTRLPGAQVADVSPNAAQFWPDDRGPPFRNAMINTPDFPAMTPTRRSTEGVWS